MQHRQKATGARVVLDTLRWVAVAKQVDEKIKPLNVSVCSIRPMARGELVVTPAGVRSSRPADRRKLAQPPRRRR
jgi:hypothetical protein